MSLGGHPGTERDSTQTAHSETIPPARWRAVIFDLWDTLVEFPWELARVHLSAMAGELRVDADLLRSTWRRLEPAWETLPLTASLQLLCRELEVKEPDIEKVRGLRLAYVRQALKPRDEVVETLRELRRRGLRLGLISACSGMSPPSGTRLSSPI